MLPEEAFTCKIKLWHMSRFYAQLSKQHTKAYRKEEVDTRARLEVATTNLHEDIYSIHKHGEVSELKRSLDKLRLESLGMEQ